MTLQPLPSEFPYIFLPVSSFSVPVSAFSFPVSFPFLFLPLLFFCLSVCLSSLMCLLSRLWTLKSLKIRTLFCRLFISFCPLLFLSLQVYSLSSVSALVLLLYFFFKLSNYGHVFCVLDVCDTLLPDFCDICKEQLSNFLLFIFSLFFLTVHFLEGIIAANAFNAL